MRVHRDALRVTSSYRCSAMAMSRSRSFCRFFRIACRMTNRCLTNAA
jgi:hypothetical protein